MEPHVPYRDSLEMQSQDNADDDADEPLPLHSEENRPFKAPRWMISHQSKWYTISQQILHIIRPRRTWRYILSSLVTLYVLYCFICGSPLLASNLPSYTGPHGVGTSDIEIALEKPRRISNTVFKATGEPAFEIETVLFSVFYPAAKDAKSSKRHHNWVSKPISATASGYARAAHVDNFLMRPLFTFGLWLIAGGITIPAQVDVPILEDENSAEGFPIIVFSHGTASSRTDYTHFCGELASRGVVVAAVEHRDGSGPGSVILGDDGREKRRVMYMRESDIRSDWPIDNEEFKKQQLAFREAEMEEVIRVLKNIHFGDGSTVLERNLRNEGYALLEWEGKLDFENLVIAGHSYGATGALQALKGSPENKSRPAKGGLVLDPGKSSGQLNNDINVPILVVHSNSWSSKRTVFFGRPHFDTVRDLVSDVLERVGASWFITSLGTSHPSVTDAPLIEPILLSWTTGATIDVKEGLHEYVRITMDFLEFLSNGGRNGVLVQDITHPEYGVDERTEKQRLNEPKDIAKYWQIHVAP
jgi:platelet-activating factor acetylhydrolase